MQAIPGSKDGLVRDRLVGAVVLAVWAFWTARMHLGDWAPDLSAVYLAARFYGLEMFDQVYAGPARFFGTDLPARWTEEVAVLGHPGAEYYPYIYPPIWAALLAPVAVRSDPIGFFAVAWVVQIALMACSVWLAYRIMRPAMGFAPWALLNTGLLATSIISLHALYHSQPQITVAFLCLLAFERLSAGRTTSAGAALGLAAAIKLTPILLLLIFLAERQVRASIVAVSVAAGIAILSMIVTGPELHLIMLEKLKVLSSQLFVWEFNYSLRAVLWQLGQVLSGAPMQPLAAPQPILVEAPAWLGIAAWAILLAGGWGLIRATRDLPPPDRLRRRVFSGFLVITLCSPLSWTHQYLFALFLLPGIFGIFRPAVAGPVILLFALAFSRQVAPWIAGWSGVLNAEMLAGVLTMSALAAAVALAPTRVAASSS